MKAVYQRVSSASVTVDGQTVASIGPGVLLLVGVTVEDTPRRRRCWLARWRRCGCSPMNTTSFSMRCGTRAAACWPCPSLPYAPIPAMDGGPDFLEAARPEKALPLFEELVDQLRKAGIADVQTGRFGADMQVSLVNDGPVTVTLDTDVWG